jgi:hypothetical protein
MSKGGPTRRTPNRKKGDFRQRDPSIWLVRIVVVLAVILAVGLIDKYL